MQDQKTTHLKSAEQILLHVIKMNNLVRDTIMLILILFLQYKH